jgi:hypothetical protein
VWSREYFHPMKEPDSRFYENYITYNKVLDDRKLITDWFAEELQEHIRAAAEVTGMNTNTSSGNPVQILNDIGVSNSLRSDGTEENVKRACFIFHYAPNNPYQLFCSQSLIQKLEVEFMQRLGAEYEGAVTGNQVKGCVYKLGIRIWNNITSNTKSRLASKNIKFIARPPKGMGGTETKQYSSDRGPNFIFRIMTIEDTDERMVSPWYQQDLGHVYRLKIMDLPYQL